MEQKQLYAQKKKVKLGAEAPSSTLVITLHEGPDLRTCRW